MSFKYSYQICYNTSCTFIKYTSSIFMNFNCISLYKLYFVMDLCKKINNLISKSKTWAILSLGINNGTMKILQVTKSVNQDAQLLNNHDESVDWTWQTPQFSCEIVVCDTSCWKNHRNCWLVVCPNCGLSHHAFFLIKAPKQPSISETCQIRGVCLSNKLFWCIVPGKFKHGITRHLRYCLHETRYQMRII